MPSFDVVCEVDMHEVANAVDQASREVGQRFDFKGVDATFTLDDDRITLKAEADFQLQQMRDILNNRMSKRQIDVGHMDAAEPEAHLNHAKQVITVKQGIDADHARKVVKLIKGEKLKVQTSIQGDQVRITGKKRDDLQTVIAFLKEADVGLPLQYTNFRD